MTSIMRKTMPGVVVVAAIAALTVTGGPLASSATAKGTLVVPGRSIGGVKLKQTRDKVHKSRPLGLKKPTSGSAVGETYISRAGTTMIVLYKKRKVIGVSTGAGPWATTAGLAYGASPAQAAGFLPGCAFYGSGRTPNPDPGDGQYCELVFQGPLRYFYLTFNAGGITSDVPAQLAGFTLSKVLIP